jgi:hypothetical protein
MESHTLLNLVRCYRKAIKRHYTLVAAAHQHKLIRAASMDGQTSRQKGSPNTD